MHKRLLHSIARIIVIGLGLEVHLAHDVPHEVRAQKEHVEKNPEAELCK